MPKKIYISGPISGTNDYMERFGSAERFLRSKGYDVVNPAAENAKLPEGTSWETCMGESLKMLCSCDAIYMLRNSMQSRGAMVEYGVACGMDKEVMMEVVFNEKNYTR